MDFKFKVGDKVRIKDCSQGSIEAVEHSGEVVTIKAISDYALQYQLEEYPTETIKDRLFNEGDIVIDLFWEEDCFEKI